MMNGRVKQNSSRRSGAAMELDRKTIAILVICGTMLVLLAGGAWIALAEMNSWIGSPFMDYGPADPAPNSN